MQNYLKIVGNKVIKGPKLGHHNRLKLPMLEYLVVEF